MHLRGEELLELRDGNPPRQAEEHLAACSDCAAELAELQAMAEGLRELPSLSPHKNGWVRLRSALQLERQRRRLARAGWIAASLAAAMSLVVLVRGAVEAVQDVKIANTTKALVAESQQLERQLRTGSSGVVSGQTAGAILALEDRIALIDMRLAAHGEDRPASDEVLELWLERVRLLDALVGVQESGVTYVGL